jgi:hypothetical protein
MIDQPEKLPIEHILRPDLPWRVSDFTECGKPAEKVAATITRDVAVEKIRRLGKQRAAFTTCMTCWSTVDNWPTFEADPVKALERETHSYRRHPRFADELRALAALVREHRDEFDGYMSGIGETVSLADRRKQRRRGA